MIKNAGRTASRHFQTYSESKQRFGNLKINKERDSVDDSRYERTSHDCRVEFKLSG